METKIIDAQASAEFTIDKEALLNMLLLEEKSSSKCCGLYLYNLDALQRQQIYHDLEYRRFSTKFDRIKYLREVFKYDWNKILLINLMRYLSDMKNKECYIEMAHKLDFYIIQNERSSLRNLEALLIGLSGLLQILPPDTFVRGMERDAQHIMRKYNLKPLPARQWHLKFGAKYTIHPIIRLSQLARFLYDNDMPFNKLINCRTRDDIIRLLSVEASIEWCKYLNKGALTPSGIGIDKCDILGVNFVAPMLYAYGQFIDNDTLIETACSLNEQFPAEHNKYLSEWRSCGLIFNVAFEAQALIELTTEFCKPKLCEMCPVYQHMTSGDSILSKLPILTQQLKL